MSYAIWGFFWGVGTRFRVTYMKRLAILILVCVRRAVREGVISGVEVRVFCVRASFFFLFASVLTRFICNQPTNQPTDRLTITQPIFASTKHHVRQRGNAETLTDGCSDDDNTRMNGRIEEEHAMHSLTRARSAAQKRIQRRAQQ